MIWRVVFANVARKWEVEEKWSLDDLFDAHEILNFKEEAERKEIERQKMNSKKVSR